jgi:hypothetical protein
MTSDGNTVMSWVYTVLASFAGALTALSFRPFKRMTTGEIALALFVGASFALFVGPLAAQWLFGKGPVDIRLFGAVLYVMASGSNILIPWVIRRIQAMLGYKDDLPTMPAEEPK